MIVDFSKLPKPGKEKPTLVLKNLDGTAIQTLGYAYNIQSELSYNEVSTLTFDIPQQVNGEVTPHYDDIVGMRIIDLVGCGQFLLIDPTEESDGIQRIKSCKAYSLEYEFAKKDIYLEAGTYNFNYLPYTDSAGETHAANDTIVGRLQEVMPEWTWDVDISLFGKYRTFDDTSKKAYEFIKSDVQETYGCIFDFDTYTRTVHVKDVTTDVPTKQVYLSSNRLIKEIEIEEDSDSIVTSLDVNGADGVTIRNVNPTGSNKIYNLDYFMNITNFSQELIDKWHAWEKDCESHQLQYYNTSIEYSLKLVQVLSEKAALTDLESELTIQENARAVTIQGISSNICEQSDLDEINQEIAALKEEIATQEALIDSIQTEADALNNTLQDINTELQMARYFSNDELTVLRRYFIEDTLEDETFVAASTETYQNTDISSEVQEVPFSIISSTVTSVNATSDHTTTSVSGGSIILGSVNANVVRATLEYSASGSFVFTAYLNNGSIGDTSFQSATIVFTGEGTVLSQSNSTLSCYASSGRLYFTKDTTAYEQSQIEWDLYEYGKQVLAEKAAPSYNFSISCGNFLSVDDYISFQNEFELGKRVYLNIDDEVWTPYVIGVNLNFDDPTDFDIEFSSTYSTFDKSFALTKLLEQSVSLGKSLGVKSSVYSEFVNSGAPSRIKSLMEDALDLAKNAVMSTGNQAITFDDAGLHIRKYLNDEHTEFDPRQMWIIDNMIAFTKDNWAHANMAIGEIFDKNLGSYTPVGDNATYDSGRRYYKKDGDIYSLYQYNASTWEVDCKTLYMRSGSVEYGVCAPYLVGTLLAGENLIIDTSNGAFRVDESGVYIDSLKFYITHGNNDYGTTLGDELNAIANEANNTARNFEEAIQEINGAIDRTVTTYYQNETPSESHKGDLWYKQDEGKLFRYDDNGAWDEITDANAIKAIADAATAQATADGKIVSYYQNYEPYQPTVGDIWYNTATGSTVVRKIEIGDNLSNITLTFDTTQTITSCPDSTIVEGENGLIYSYEQKTTSSKTQAVLAYGFLNNVNGTLYASTWSRGAYTLPTTFGVVQSVDKTSPFYDCIQGSFVNNYDCQKWYRYNGYEWVKIEDGDIAVIKTEISSINKTISDVIDTTGLLKASAISGVINAQNTKMQSGNGNVLFDDDGLWLLNKTSKSTSTKAIWLNEEGILFGTGTACSNPATSDNWEWTTAIGHDGIVAEALAGKKLSGCEIVGGSLKVGATYGTNGSITGYNLSIDQNGNAVFKGTVQGSEFKDSKGNSMMTSGYKFSSDYLELKGLNVNDNFIIDSNGNVTVNGTINMKGGSISWSNIDETNSQSYNKAVSAYNTAVAAQSAATAAKSSATTAQNIAKQIADGTYSNGTFIKGHEIYSPEIYADVFSVIPANTASTGSWNGGFDLYAYYGSKLYEMLHIGYIEAQAPTVVFESPASAYAEWNFDSTRFDNTVHFYGTVDFSQAEVEGLTVTAVFG